jgi:hypothetical protein
MPSVVSDVPIPVDRAYRGQVTCVGLPGIPEWPVCGNPISKLGRILLHLAVFDLSKHCRAYSKIAAHFKLATAQISLASVDNV